MPLIMVEPYSKTLKWLLTAYYIMSKHLSSLPQLPFAVSLPSAPSHYPSASQVTDVAYTDAWFPFLS